ncbi:MAG: putative porin, partial [Bdellovibrionales bacterium]|nr:putative porin [Bdellovibrionales bacterium]
MKRNILQTTLGVCVASLLLVGSTASAEEGSSWADSIKLGGDLRFRHERIDQDGKVVRTRQRIRARLSLSAEVDEDFDVHMRLASGSDDPVSTNSTLGSGFSTKDFGLDLAYFDWNIEKSDFHLMAGKMKQPFYVVKDLIYDSDLNPEGGALQYDFDLGGTGSLIATAAGWWGEERSSDSDTMMWGGQLLADLDIAESAALETGVSYYYWDNTKGFDPLFDSGDSFGNSTMTDLSGMTVYANDFGIINPFAKLKIDVGMPLAVYADVAINTQEDTAGEDT